MPWKNNDPDPFEVRRRKLAQQERALANRRKQLNLKIAQTESPAAQARRKEPPVWRLEDDSPAPPTRKPSAARRRNLAHKRRRDMLIFVGCFIVLLIVLGIALLVMHVHNLMPVGGA